MNWGAILQTIVAFSITMAEYIAIIEDDKKALWLKGLTTEMGYKQGYVTLYCDNQSSNNLTKIPHHYERTKHVDVKFDFVRDVTEKWLTVVDKLT